MHDWYQYSVVVMSESRQYGLVVQSISTLSLRTTWSCYRPAEDGQVHVIHLVFLSAYVSFQCLLHDVSTSLCNIVAFLV